MTRGVTVYTTLKANLNKENVDTALRVTGINRNEITITVTRVAKME